ncbi:unnamed protein product [Eruca vesicaria subsp. sativa]|uniref:Uncharacterized protein n=1 Tax=Eruca vesicaria subsp. sativa TaxID=29727 RepID=A0ABC8K6N9_ERUVS|nr:unnamed protein product [Eruca vesicaria subsp. sativa]
MRAQYNLRGSDFGDLCRHFYARFSYFSMSLVIYRMHDITRFRMGGKRMERHRTTA